MSVPKLESEAVLERPTAPAAAPEQAAAAPEQAAAKAPAEAGAEGAVAEQAPSPASMGLKAVYLSVFIDMIGIGLIIPVLPFLILELTDGGGATEVGLTVATYSGAQVLGSVVMGALSDRVGRKPVLLLSLLGSALSYLLCALATDFTQLLLARTLAGLMGGSIPVAQAFVADVTTVEERPRYLGLIGACIGVAFTFGPGIGAGVLAAAEAAGQGVRAQYSAVFFLASAVAATAFAYALRTLREPPKKGGAAARPALPWAIFVIALAKFAANYAFTVMQSTYALVLRDLYGYASAELGAVLVVSGLLIAVLQGALIKRIVARAGEHGASALGAVLLGCGLAPLTLVSLQPAHFTLFAVMTAGFAIGQTALPALVSRYAPPGGQGAALGLGQSAQALARVVSPLASGFLYDEDPSWPYLSGGALCVASALIPLALRHAAVEPSATTDAPKDVEVAEPVGKGSRA